MIYNELNPEEERIMLHKGTEAPFSGEYDNFFQAGTYLCRRCNTPLYESKDKFEAHCGWPSFDQEIPGRVIRHHDHDGLGAEITCAACGAHLGHVFVGEKMTPQDMRHCVNSLALRFAPARPSEKSLALKSAVFGGGCFWCTEAIFQRLKGVHQVISGYAGGQVANPSYEEVSRGQSGHAEVIKIEYDPTELSYETLLEIFFALHDLTTINQQGNDYGEQYRSIILYVDAAQKKMAEDYIQKLTKEKIYTKAIVTELKPLTDFYPAEKYHSDYFERNAGLPYCRLVIAPKIRKLEEKFASALKA